MIVAEGAERGNGPPARARAKLWMTSLWTRAESRAIQAQSASSLRFGSVRDGAARAHAPCPMTALGAMRARHKARRIMIECQTRYQD